MAMCSGMMGGLEGYSVCLPSGMEEDGRNQNSQVTTMSVAAPQRGPWWFMFIRRWTFGEIWSSSTGNEAVEVIKERKEASPWLTVFQIFAIMLLTVTLYRNLEGLWSL